MTITINKTHATCKIAQMGAPRGGEGQSLASYQVHRNGYQFLTATLQTLCVFLVKFFSSSGVKSNLGICCMPVPIYLIHSSVGGPCHCPASGPVGFQLLWVQWQSISLKNAINDLTCHMIHRITFSVPTTWFYIQGIAWSVWG